MGIFRSIGNWVRHKNTQLMLDQEGIVHIGKTSRAGEIPSVVSDILNDFPEKDYVLVDFSQCSAKFASSIKQLAGHVFMNEVAAVFFNKVLKCILPHPMDVDIFTTRGDLFKDGVIMDSATCKISILNGEVKVEQHAQMNQFEHLHDICGFLNIRKVSYTLWLIDEPATEKQPESLLPIEPADGIAVGTFDVGIPDEEPQALQESIAQEEIAEPVIEPMPEPPTNPFPQEEKVVVPPPVEPIRPSLFDRFEYKSAPKPVPPYKEIVWGGVKLVRFNTKVTSEELLHQVLQVDIYHFAQDVNSSIAMQLLSNGYGLFTGKDGSEWTGKVLIKKELLTVLGDGYQQIRPRQKDSSPRAIPSMAKGPVIQA